MSAQVSQGIIVTNKQGGKGNSGISMIKCIPVLRDRGIKGQILLGHQLAVHVWGRSAHGRLETYRR